MGRRKGRKRLTRAEKVRRSEGEPATRPAGKKPEDRNTRREVSSETRSIAVEYARMMGWTLEQVLPHAVGAEG